MASILKKIFNTSNKTMTEETSKFSKDSQNILRAWAKNLREKYKKEKYSSDEVFKDGLFLIEWDDAGINARTNINPADTKMALINLIRGQAGCSPFPQQAPSDCAFAFDNRQNLLLMVAILTANNWSRRANLIPDVGRCYEISVPKKGKLDVDEHFIFNI